MKKYRVTLTAAERDELERLLGRGKADVRKLKHAQVLLKADQAEGGPAWTDERIVAALAVGVATVPRLGSGSSRRASRRRSTPTGSASASTNASSMASRKPSCSRWPARPHPRSTGAGPCACWPDAWSS